MDWQQWASLSIVAAAAILLAGSMFRSRKKPGRGGSCVCPGAGSDFPRQNSIVYRARKGERPEIVVKWR